MIKISGLVKHYGTTPILRGVHLHVKSGEFVTLIGPNGTGKSTLMRIVATLLNPSSGEVKIGGWLLPQYSDRVRRHIGLVSHQPLLYGDLTAGENLLFFARLYQLPNAEAVAKQALKQVGLSSRQRDAVRTFSRGMLQRLSIARATLHQPDVLLLDEPYTGLDPQASRLLDELLVEQKQYGRTILMITHDLIHGLSLCDRLVILNRGKIVRELSHEEARSVDILALYAQETGSRE